MNGNEVPTEGLLEMLPKSLTEKKERFFTLFGALGTMHLKPIFDELDGKMEYEDLKIFRILYLLENPEN